VTPILEVKNVSKTYGHGLLNRHVTRAADDVSISIPDSPPTITAVAGESGSGKTTLSLLMMGQVRPDSGQVLYRGKDLRAMSGVERQQMRREVQPIFQDPFAAYNPFYRVDHVLQMPIRHFKLAKTKEEGLGLIHEALEMVGLRPAETLGRYPHQLSGGQRQRLMVARALLCRPRLIMADEPVSMVDASLRATILASLRRLNRELGIGIVYITHDLTTAFQIAENITIMYAGSVVEAGTVDQVIRNPKHPYTQLLISSIPLPDKRKHWGGQVKDDSGIVTRQSGGCRFAPRCPAAMDKCWATRPPMYALDHGRTVACFLFEGGADSGN
jgi:peptide/nickel transport system ATP-binding protein